MRNGGVLTTDMGPLTRQLRRPPDGVLWLLDLLRERSLKPSSPGVVFGLVAGSAPVPVRERDLETIGGRGWAHRDAFGGWRITPDGLATHARCMALGHLPLAAAEAAAPAGAPLGAPGGAR